MTSFADWLNSDETAPPAEIRIVQEAFDVVIADDQEANVDSPLRRWPVHTHGIAEAEDGHAVLVGSYRFTPGMVIAPSENLCGYLVIAVTGKSAWYAAYDRAPPSLALLDIHWPDFAGIHMSLGHRPVPEHLELRRGYLVKPGFTFEFEPAGARMTLVRLWAHAAHWAYVSRQGESLDLLWTFPSKHFGPAPL